MAKIAPVSIFPKQFASGTYSIMKEFCENRKGKIMNIYISAQAIVVVLMVLSFVLGLSLRGAISEVKTAISAKKS